MVRPRPPLDHCREAGRTRQLSCVYSLDGLRLPPLLTPSPDCSLFAALFLGRSWRRERHLGPPEGDRVRRAARGARAVRPRPEGHRPALRRGVPPAGADRPVDARRPAMEQGSRAARGGSDRDDAGALRRAQVALILTMATTITTALTSTLTMTINLTRTLTRAQRRGGGRAVRRSALRVDQLRCDACRIVSDSPPVQGANPIPNPNPDLTLTTCRTPPVSPPVQGGVCRLRQHPVARCRGRGKRPRLRIRALT